MMRGVRAGGIQVYCGCDSVARVVYAMIYHDGVELHVNRCISSSLILIRTFPGGGERLGSVVARIVRV